MQGAAERLNAFSGGRESDVSVTQCFLLAPLRNPRAVVGDGERERWPLFRQPELDPVGARVL